MYKPMSLKKTLDKFESVPVIFEAPNKNTMKYLRYRGFAPMNVSSLFSWIRVVLPSSVVEDLMDLLNINNAYVDYNLNIFNTEKIEIGKKIALPISFTAQELKFTDVYSVHFLGRTIHFTGKGIKVGVVDTGANRVFSKSVHAQSNYPLGMYDFNGHGTHVSSTIGAPFNSPKYAGNIDMHGIAPESILEVYNAMPIGTGATSDIIRGIENVYKRGAKIINMSLGSEIDSDYKYEDDPIVNFIDKLCKADKDLLFVVASGNSGPDKLSTPAISPNVLAIGSKSYTDNARAYFSTYGEFTLPDGIVRKVPDFVSYGGGRVDENATKDELILAFTGSNASDLTDGINPNGFGLMHGTSQATPHVAGAMSIAKQYMKMFKSNAYMNARAIRNLFECAHKTKDNELGYGLMDKDLAMAIARALVFDEDIKTALNEGYIFKG